MISVRRSYYLSLKVSIKCLFVYEKYTYPFFLIQLEQLTPPSMIKACECKSFELTLSGGAMSWQSSKLGMYKQEQNRSINGRVFYYNTIRGQYLFWTSNRGGFWMVSRTKVRLDISMMFYRFNSDKYLEGHNQICHYIVYLLVWTQSKTGFGRNN